MRIPPSGRLPSGRKPAGRLPARCISAGRILPAVPSGRVRRFPVRPTRLLGRPDGPAAFGFQQREDHCDHCRFFCRCPRRSDSHLSCIRIQLVVLSRRPFSKPLTHIVKLSVIRIEAHEPAFLVAHLRLQAVTDVGIWHRYGLLQGLEGVEWRIRPRCRNEDHVHLRQPDQRGDQGRVYHGSADHLGFLDLQ